MATPAALVSDNVNILLVSPHGAGNIGSVARAIKNTGFKNLSLVDPIDFHNDEAYSMACGAVDVLERAAVFESIAEAVAGSGLVAGATRRRGKLREPLLTLDEAVEEAASSSRANVVTFIFGREDRGLENHELAFCDILFDIPSDDGCPSLNLSHAVFAVCHRLFTRSLPPQPPTVVAAPRGEINNMYAHLNRVIKVLGYGNGGKGGDHLAPTIMRTLRRLFGRTGLMEKEVNMLRGIFAEIEKKIELGRPLSDREDKTAKKP